MLQARRRGPLNIRPRRNLVPIQSAEPKTPPARNLLQDGSKYSLGIVDRDSKPFHTAGGHAAIWPEFLATARHNRVRRLEMVSATARSPR